MRTLTESLEYKDKNKTEEWVHLFLNTDGNNAPFSEGLKITKRYYYGPVEMPLKLFSRCCGPEGTMQYKVSTEDFENKITVFRNLIKEGWDMPPLIVNFCDDKFYLTDGNHRFEALVRSGKESYSVIVWLTEEADRIVFEKKYAEYA